MDGGARLSSTGPQRVRHHRATSLHIAEEQCCGSPGWTGQGRTAHIHVSIPLHTPRPSRLPHNTEQSSLYSSTVGPQLSVHYRCVCMCLFQSPAKVVACTLNSVGLSAPLHPSLRPWSSYPVRLGAGWAGSQGGEISRLRGQGRQQTM